MNATYDFHHYFGSLAPDVMRWSENGSVVEWYDGTTIAFRHELQAILERLQGSGWPVRFGAIGLLLAACRESWHNDAIGRTYLREIILQSRKPDSAGSNLTAAETNAPNVTAADGTQISGDARLEQRTWLVVAGQGDTAETLRLMETVERLNRVHELRFRVPSTLAKAELAEMVFLAARPKCAQIGPLLDAFRANVCPEPIKKPEPDSNRADLIRDLQCLASGLLECDLDALDFRLRTGLECTVAAAPVDVPRGETARSLIDRLQVDETLGGVARLARKLLAIMSLPRRLSDPENLPVGGVADITNRGNLDQLLLSELVHDDLTLATRVALREALYLRRDPLSRPLSRQRFVLVDTGIRLWGVPRVFATAVSLAISAQAERGLEVNVFRPKGTAVEMADLAHEAGLVDQLAALSHPAHPGEALGAFHEELTRTTGESDAVLVTSDEVWEDPEFRQAIDAAKFESLHIATVSREGRFQLIQYSRRGQRVVKEAHFSLEDVLTARDPRASTRIHDRDVLSPRPAILGVEPFPLLLPTPLDLNHSWNVHGLGVVSYRADGQLLVTSALGEGAKLVHVGLPAGRLHWCSSRLVDDHVILVVGKLGLSGLHAIRLHRDLSTWSVRRLQATSTDPVRVFGHRDWIFVVYPDQIAVFDPESGLLLDSLIGRFSQRLIGRFYAVDSSRWGGVEWHALSFDGHRIQDHVISGNDEHAPPFLAVFDSGEDGEGPIGVMSTGEIVSLDRGLRRQIQLPNLPCEVSAVSRDGRRIVLHTTDKADWSTYRSAASQLWLVNYDGEVSRVYGNPVEIAEQLWLSGWSVNRRNVRSRFRRAVVDGLGRLTLVSTRNAYWPLMFEPSRNEIAFPKQPTQILPCRRGADFLPVEAPESRQLFSVATWQDGSRAILDRRGILHLQSSQPHIPEFSIVLAEGPTAGWVADGSTWGPSYFIGKRRATAAMEIYRNLLEPFVACLT